MDIQAALGIHQLAKLDAFISRRTEIARFYNTAFSEVDEIKTPEPVQWDHRHAWHLYTPLVLVEKLSIDRDRFMEELKRENIGTGLHFKAVHHHPYYKNSLAIPPGELANADYASDRILSLPLFPRMTMDDALDVVDAVKKVIARNKR
jgi:dTDP-4-amino-4,6-dideoxygalactose transaminase